MSCCAVPNCSSRREKNHRLLKIPVDPTQKQKWAQLIGQDLGASKSSNVCEKRFDESEFDDWKSLRSLAVPSSFDKVGAETIQPKNVKEEKESLANSCRACLKQEQNMIFLLDNTKEAKAIIEKLASILNSEVEFKKDFPTFLCKSCEERVNSYFEFLEQCRMCNNLIYKHMEKLVGKHDQTEGIYDNVREDNVSKLGIYENMSVDTADGDEEPSMEAFKRSKPNQRIRLTQQSKEAVDRAVGLVRDKLYRHRICIFCSFKASSSRTLSVHVTRIHSNLKGRWCLTCNELTEDITLHNQQLHYDDLRCTFCGKILGNMGHFMEHMAGHSGSRFFECPSCAKSFLTSRHLRAHEKRHEKLQCKFCQKKFLRVDCLERHVRASHDGGDSLRSGSIELQNYCTKCHKKVKSLSDHNKRQHALAPPSSDEKLNLCMYCGKQFRTRYKLTVHIRTHTGETPYKCQYCDKRLKSRNILVAHERTHTGEKPYSCTVCGKKFSQSSVLKTHLRIHNGKPEQCTICDKTFCRPAELKLHLRNHTGEKPYTCHTCGQSFKQKSHLVEHTKRHSNERPYKCSLCDKSFKKVSTLKCHLQIHSGEKPFKCSQCPYACRQPYSLTQHMQQHENDKPQPSRPHVCEVCLKSFHTVAHLTTHLNRFHSHLQLKSDEQQVSLTQNQEQFVDENFQSAAQARPMIEEASNEVDVVEGVINNELCEPVFQFTVMN